MSVSVSTAASPPVIYPDSDGEPMADNTKQFRWIVTIHDGLDSIFANDPSVFVAGDLLWYPVEGDNKTRAAPDVMVVFGRPKGDRGSYRQWEEDHVAPQVVFEVLSPGNRAGALARKIEFYERFGVDECYVYDPDSGDLSGWHRMNGQWQAIPSMQGWVSPRLGVRFQTVDDELDLRGPDGRPFISFVELSRQRDATQRQAERAQRQAERLAAQLRALGVEPDAATPE